MSPAPVFGLPLVEDYFQRLSALKSGPEIADYESWVGNPDGFESLVDALRGQGPAIHRVLLLSGDVHYGYTNRLVIGEEEGSPLV